MMSKHLWLKAREQFEYENNREPNEEEMNEAYIAAASSLYDRADLLRDQMKERGEKDE